MRISPLRKSSGFALLGVVLTIAVFAAMGAGLALMVATNQATRTQQLYTDQAFYSSHAGFEYALARIINNNDTNVSLTRDFMGAPIAITRSDGKIHVTGVKGQAQAVFSISDPHALSGSSCLNVDIAGAKDGNTGGVPTNQVQGIVLSKAASCGPVIITTITATWQPDNSEKLTTIQVGGTNVYSNGTGQGSGTTFDITDVTINDTANHPINFFQWNTDVRDHNFTLTFNLSDGSQKTVNVNFLAPSQASCLTVNTAAAQLTLTASKLKDLTGMTVQNTCAQKIRIDKMTVSWSPTSPTRNLNEVLVNAATIFSGTAATGTQIDIDSIIPATTTYNVDRFRFDDEMLGRNYTILWTMADGTTKTTTLNLFASNENTCLTVNTSNISRGGTGNVDLLGLTLQNTCSADIGITALTVSWSGETTRRVTEVKMDGTVRYTNATGVASGVVADFGDNDVYRKDGLAAFPLDDLRFNSAVTFGLTFTLNFTMADGTTKTATAVVGGQASFLTVNTSAASLASGGKDLIGITINNSGVSTITWDKVVVTWTGTGTRAMKQINVAGTKMWSGSANIGTTVDITDVTLTSLETKTIDFFRFDGGMTGRSFTIQFIMLDGSSLTTPSFTPP